MYLIRKIKLLIMKANSILNKMAKLQERNAAKVAKV